MTDEQQPQKETVEEKRVEESRTETTEPLQPDHVGDSTSENPDGE